MDNLEAQARELVNAWYHDEEREIIAVVAFARSVRAEALREAARRARGFVAVDGNPVLSASELEALAAEAEVG